MPSLIVWGWLFWCILVNMMLSPKNSMSCKSMRSYYVLIHLRSRGFKLYPVLIDCAVSEKDLYYCFYSFRFDYLLSYYTSLFLPIKLLILDIFTFLLWFYVRSNLLNSAMTPSKQVNLKVSTKLFDTANVKYITRCI